jgi:hypothetical protein
MDWWTDAAAAAFAGGPWSMMAHGLSHLSDG